MTKTHPFRRPLLARSGIVFVAALVTAAVLAPSAVATQHDPCLHEVNGFIQGQDAGNTWLAGNEMFQPIDCEGEMDAQDPHDWYWVPIDATQSFAAIKVTICNSFTTIGPWDQALELYFLPAGDLLPVIGATPIVAEHAPSITPGLLMDSSDDGACDTVEATTDLANGGRWYIHIDRHFGQGGYNMVIE